MPKRGRSDPFVDPSLTALDAHPIYAPLATQGILFAIATASTRESGGAIFVPSLPALERILVDPAGHQHVLLRSNGGALQIEIEGADITKGPVRLAFTALSIDIIGPIGRHLCELQRILFNDVASGAPATWTTRKVNLRDAIVVHDFRKAGRRYYDAAIFLHGIEIVERDWPTGILPARMRRNWLRAQRFISGGWRAFLK